MNNDNKLVIAPIVERVNLEKVPLFEVTRAGTRLVTANNFDDLHTALRQAEELEEQLVNPNFSIDCYPLDGVVALNRALERVFGFTHALERKSFFGNRPPLTLVVPTGIDKETQVVYGQMAPPLWEGGWISVQVDPNNPLAISIMGEIKRKFEVSIAKVVAVAREILKNESIYRNAACELNLDYISTGHYHPVHNAPKFINLNKQVELILPRDIEFELKIDVWDMIRRPSDFRENGIPLKHGVLLSGKFGTGKSLTSYRTAQIAAENGWTYLYLKTPEQFVTAYTLAQLYSPCVLFVEDVDAIFGGERTAHMNDILEIMDGVSAKTAEVIVIFTTNTPENINEAFLRSGRVDTHIQLRPLDAEAAGRFVQSMSNGILASDFNIERVGEAFKDLVPADITEGMHKARKRAIGEFGSDIKGRVTTEMLADAGEVVRRQRGLISERKLHPDTEALLKVREASVIVNRDGIENAARKVFEKMM